MSEAEKPAAEAPPAAAPSKPSFIGSVLRILIPAALAAGAAYGGSRSASAHAAAPSDHHEPRHEVKPPGPTQSLEAFLVTVPDANKKSHAMKVTIAVEFDALAKEDAIKAFIPRMRDAMLAHLRALTYEEATDGAHLEKLRTELLERCRAVGASSAEKVLVTDFVVQ